MSEAREAMTVKRMLDLLVHAGLIDEDARDRPDGYDAYATISKVTALVDYMNDRAGSISAAEVDAIAKSAFERREGNPHPWEGALPWVEQAIRDAFAAGSSWRLHVAAIESATSSSMTGGVSHE